MSLVEVLPVEPVIATTRAAAPSSRAPGARERLQRRERVGVREHAPRSRGRRRAARGVLGRDEHPPGAGRERLARRGAAVVALARAGRRTAPRRAPRASRCHARRSGPAGGSPRAPQQRARPRAAATRSGVPALIAPPAARAAARRERLAGDGRRRRTGSCARPRTPGPARGPCRRSRRRRPAARSAIARAIASRRSTMRLAARVARRARRRATPARISAMICSRVLRARVVGGDERRRRRARAAISPISGRLPRSRSPPAPNTQITRPPLAALPSARARRASTFSSESGVWA